MMEQKIEAVLQADAARVDLPDDLIGRIKLEAAKPVPRRRPVWQWAVAAVLALLVAGAADWSLGTGAVAAVLKSLGLYVQVQEMNETEEAEFKTSQYDPTFHTRTPDANGRYTNDQGTVSVRLSHTKVTLAEAQQAVTYGLLLPKALPEPESVELNQPGDPNGRVTLIYNQGQLMVSQQVLGEGEMFQYNAPEGAIKDATVAGQPAVIIRGNYIMQDDGNLKWNPDFSTQLLFARDRQHFMIMALGSMPAEELIKIAESLE